MIAIVNTEFVLWGIWGSFLLVAIGFTFGILREKKKTRRKNLTLSFEAPAQVTPVSLARHEEVIRAFLRPSLVQELASGSDPLRFRPEIRNLAILFCDIRDFTRITEILNPYEKLAFLNQYFTMMTKPILDHGGEVDKIMGDCVMAVFPDGRQAVLAALDMRRELEKFNAGFIGSDQPLIRNGFGIAKGEVVLGNFGSNQKLDRTVIGEAVNIAARLESKTKMYSLDIVVTEDVIQDLGPDFPHCRWIDNASVKGSSRRLKLYEVYGYQNEETVAYKDGTRFMLEKALTIYFNKGFPDASRLFKAMKEQLTTFSGEMNDGLLEYYIGHCDAWLQNPKVTLEFLEKWEGVHVFHEK